MKRTGPAENLLTRLAQQRGRGAGRRTEILSFEGQEPIILEGFGDRGRGAKPKSKAAKSVSSRPAKQPKALAAR